MHRAGALQEVAESGQRLEQMRPPGLEVTSLALPPSGNLHEGIAARTWGGSVWEHC